MIYGNRILPHYSLVKFRYVYFIYDVRTRRYDEALL